jgi:hypothetical protein
MIVYAFTIEGKAADEQTWTVTGKLVAANEGQFPDMLHRAQLAAFHDLTQGKAIYGKPGAGCRGPYQITRFELKRE